MSSSEKDSEYEPSLRTLNTSDDTATLSDNDYFTTSEEEGRAWRSLELSEERMNAAAPRFRESNSHMLTRVFSKKKVNHKSWKNNNSKLFS